MLYGIAQKEQLGARRRRHRPIPTPPSTPLLTRKTYSCLVLRAGFDKAVEECKYRAFAAASNRRRASSQRAPVY